MIKYRMQASTFLIIENDTHSADIIAEALQGRGHSVFKAADGSSGVSMARSIVPSLIFLNLSTPGTNGLGICKTFKEIESLKNVPIVLLTMREGKFDAMYKALFGIAGFMKKPITPEAVLEKVEGILPPEPEVKAPEAEVAEPEAIAPEEEEQPAGYPAGEPPLLLDIEEPEELQEEETPGHPEKAALFKEMEEAPGLEDILEEGPPYEEPQEKEPQEKEESAPVFQIIEEQAEAPGVEEEKEEDRGGYPGEEAPAPVHAERPVARNKIIIYSISILAAIGIILSISYTVFIMDRQGSIQEEVEMPEIPPEPAPEEAPPPEPEAPPGVEEGKPASGAPVQEAGPVALKPYYVQFGAFGIEENALGLLRKLKDEGLEVFIHEGTTRSGRPLYRVLLADGFDSPASARSKAKGIRDAKKLETAVYRIKQ